MVATKSDLHSFDFVAGATFQLPSASQAPFWSKQAPGFACRLGIYKSVWVAVLPHSELPREGRGSWRASVDPFCGSSPCQGRAAALVLWPAPGFTFTRPCRNPFGAIRGREGWSPVLYAAWKSGKLGSSREGRMPCNGRQSIPLPRGLHPPRAPNNVRWRR